MMWMYEEQLEVFSATKCGELFNEDMMYHLIGFAGALASHVSMQNLTFRDYKPFIYHEWHIELQMLP
jgi:hypothetical protein